MADKLHAAILSAIETLPEASTPALVRWLHENHQPIINAYEQQWVDEKLSSLLNAQRKGRNPMRSGGRPSYSHPAQSRLPFIENFEQIPFWLELEPGSRQKHGRRVRLPDATLKDLKQRRLMIKGAFSKELPQLMRLIEVMQPYDKAYPGIRVKEALERRATARRGGKQA